MSFPSVPDSGSQVTTTREVGRSAAYSTFAEANWFRTAVVNAVSAASAPRVGQDDSELHRGSSGPGTTTWVRLAGRVES